MKQRFSSLDVRAISHELNQTLAGSRLANVYDLVTPSAAAASTASAGAAASASRAVLLRFSRGQDKFQLVVDPGFRCHLTAYDARATATGGGGGSGAHNAPSAFVSRLRTFISGRHVTCVTQLGTDRVIELRFSDGQLRLYLEFFAAGNVVLTDAHAKILALKRTVAAFRSASLDVTLNVNNPYALAAKHNQEDEESRPKALPVTHEQVKSLLEAEVAAEKAAAEAGADGVPQKKKSKKSKSLSRVLGFKYTELSQVLIDHAMLTAGFDTSSQPAEILADDARLDALVKVLQEARKLADSFIAEGASGKGYIIATRRAGVASPDEPGEGGENASPANGSDVPAKEDLDYVDFHPFSPRQFETDTKYVVLPFDTFNKAADEFYSHLQGMRAHRQLHQQESAASKKLESTKRDQASRIESLQEAQQLNIRKAAAITANQDWVQAAIEAVNDYVKDGVDWEDLAKIIENSADENPVAAMIKLPLRLGEGIITLQLEENPEDYDYGEEDEEYNGEDRRYDENGEEVELLSVDVKLALSAWSNATEYYDQKRVAAAKEQKTKEVTSMALRNAEKKVAEELKRVQKGGKPAPQLIRRQLWFEKFLWFLSSDGYLVIAAREQQQSEIVYRRYLRRGDVYVHADIHGSPGIIVVKNRLGAQPDDPIPPTTLAQAGTLAVCASEAWETKAGLGAFWVRSDQVFKTTTSGDVLPPGSFDIRGEKNHLPPPQRVLGFGLLFKIRNANTPEQFTNVPADDAAEGDVEDQEADEPREEEKPQAADEARFVETKDESAPGETAEGGPEAESEQVTTGDANPKTEEDADAAAQEKDETAAESQEKQVTDEQEKQTNPQPEEAEEAEEAEADTRHPTPQWKGKAALRSSSPTPSWASTTATKSGQAGKRGQKAKAKKLAKYKDQDEEDRARAERLIGVAAGREKAEAKAKAKAKREAELAAYEERRRAQRERQMQATRKFEAERQAKLAGGGRDDEANGGSADGAGAGDDEGGLEVLATLVGRAAAGDEILEAVPVCAPWSALARLKYKVKMQPGATKKGRAMRDVLERWKHVAEAAQRGGGNNANGVLDEQSRDPERMWPREVELLRGLKMEEAANCVPVSKLTLMMSGGFGGSSGGGGGGKNTKQSGPWGGGKKGGAGKGGKRK